MNIFIYKTNIQNYHDVKTIERALIPHNNITRWTVDCDDIDKVLRIEATNNNTEEIAQIITNAGYDCEELPD